MGDGLLRNQRDHGVWERLSSPALKESPESFQGDFLRHHNQRKQSFGTLAARALTCQERDQESSGEAFLLQNKEANECLNAVQLETQNEKIDAG